MKLRILYENDQVVNNEASIDQNISNNSLFSYAYEMIRNKVNGFLTTAMDYINTFLFNGNMILTDFSRNTVISDDMTSIFTDTRVNVWVYNSKILNAFTFPGVSVDSSFMARIATIFPNFITTGLTIFSIFYSCMFNRKMFQNMADSIEQGNQYLQYDPISKKYTMSIKEVTVFISSGLVEGLSDNEVKAVLLHEVGHNTMIAADIISSILRSTFAGISIVKLITLFSDNFLSKLKKEKLINPIDEIPSRGIILGGYKPRIEGILTGINHNTPDDRVYFIYHSLFQFFLIYVVISFIVSYFRRRMEVYSDEFAIKCGYGEYLESAILKLKQHNFNLFSKPVIKLNILDHIINILTRLSSKIVYIISMFKLGDYPDINTRINMIHRKTEKFDNSDQNINRSKHIETFVI